MRLKSILKRCSAIIYLRYWNLLSILFAIGLISGTGNPAGFGNAIQQTNGKVVGVAKTLRHNALGSDGRDAVNFTPEQDNPQDVEQDF